MLLSRIQPFLEQVEACPEVRRIILFGSRARGDQSPRSDVDLAIDAPTMTRECWLRLLDAADEVPTLIPLDMVLLQAASEALRRQIDAEGKVLYERAAA